MMANDPNEYGNGTLNKTIEEADLKLKSKPQSTIQIKANKKKAFMVNIDERLAEE